MFKCYDLHHLDSPSGSRPTPLRASKLSISLSAWQPYWAAHVLTSEIRLDRETVDSDDVKLSKKMHTSQIEIGLVSQW